MKLNQLKTGAILSYVIIAVNNIVGLLYTPFMLRMMGQNEYGLYSLTSSVVAYLTVLDIGFNNAIIRYTAKYKAESKIEEQHRLFGMFFSLYCVIAIFVLLVGAILYLNVENLFDRTMKLDDLRKVKVMVILLIANIAFTFPMSIWGGIITAYENFVFQKVVNLARVILNPIAMIVMLLFGYRAVGMVVVTTLFNVITLSINAFYCIHKLNIKVKFGTFQWGLLKEVSIYSFWIFLSSLVDRLYWGSGQFVLGIFRSTVEIAIFAVAIQMQSFYTSFSYAISSLLLPKVVRLVSIKAPRKEISDFFIRISRIQFYPISLILFGFILFGRRFITLWAGSDYEPAYYMAICFMFPQLYTTMQQTGYSILQAENRVKFRAIAIFGASVLAVLIAVPVSKIFGGLGVAVCIAVGLFVGNLLVLDIYYQKKIGLNMKQFWFETMKLSIWPIVLTSLYACFLHLYPVNSNLGYLSHIAVYAIIYILGCVLFNFNMYEKNLFISPIKKIVNY